MEERGRLGEAVVVRAVGGVAPTARRGAETAIEIDDGQRYTRTADGTFGGDGDETLWRRQRLSRNAGGSRYSINQCGYSSDIPGHWRRGNWDSGAGAETARPSGPVRHATAWVWDAGDGGYEFGLVKFGEGALLGGAFGHRARVTCGGCHTLVLASNRCDFLNRLALVLGSLGWDSEP